MTSIFIKMKAKYNSNCVECKEPIKEGDDIVYDSSYRVTFCQQCGKEAMG